MNLLEIVRDVRRHLEDRGAFTFTQQRQVTLKGFSGEHPIVRVAWN